MRTLIIAMYIVCGLIGASLVSQLMEMVRP